MLRCLIFILSATYCKAQVTEFYDLYEDVTWNHYLTRLPNGNYIGFKSTLFVYQQEHVEEVIQNYDSITQFVILYDANRSPLDSFPIKINEHGTQSYGGNRNIFIDTTHQRLIKCIAYWDYSIPNLTFAGYRLLIFDYNLQVLEDNFIPHNNPCSTNNDISSHTVKIFDDGTFISNVRTYNADCTTRYLISRYTFDGELLAELDDEYYSRKIDLVSFFEKKDAYYYWRSLSPWSIYKMDENLNVTDSISSEIIRPLMLTTYNGDLFMAGIDYKSYDPDTTLSFIDTTYFAFGEIKTDSFYIDKLFHYSYFEHLGLEESSQYFITPGLPSFVIYSLDYVYAIISKFYPGTTIVDYHILNCFKLNGEENWTYLLKSTHPSIISNFNSLQTTDDGGVILFFANIYDGQTAKIQYIKFSKDGEQEFVSGTTQPTNFVLEKILYFPNPTNNIVTISNLTKPNAAYQISNDLGQVVQQGKMQSDNTISVAALAKGIYILNIEGHAPIKVVKE